jgi:hypothetical protein
MARLVGSLRAGDDYSVAQVETGRWAAVLAVGGTRWHTVGRRGRDGGGHEGGSLSMAAALTVGSVATLLLQPLVPNLWPILGSHLGGQKGWPTYSDRRS